MEINNKKKRTGRGTGIKRGAENPATKLTVEQVLEIRRSYQYRVVTESMLAKKFNVTPVTIHFILTGQTWKHIGGAKKKAPRPLKGFLD